MGKLKLMLHLGKAQRADDTLFLRRLSKSVMHVGTASKKAELLTQAALCRYLKLMCVSWRWSRLRALAF